MTRNVAKLVRVSTPDCEVGSGLDPIAAKRLLAAIREERLFSIYLCAILFGMRRGELLVSPSRQLTSMRADSPPGRRSPSPTASCRRPLGR